MGASWSASQPALARTYSLQQRSLAPTSSSTSAPLLLAAAAPSPGRADFYTSTGGFGPIQLDPAGSGAGRLRAASATRQTQRSVIRGAATVAGRPPSVFAFLCIRSLCCIAHDGCCCRRPSDNYVVELLAPVWPHSQLCPPLGPVRASARLSRWLVFLCAKLAPSALASPLLPVCLCVRAFDAFLNLRPAGALRSRTATVVPLAVHCKSGLALVCEPPPLLLMLSSSLLLLLLLLLVPLLLLLFTIIVQRLRRTDTQTGAREAARASTR